MEKLAVTVERVTYQSEENGFAVLRASSRGYADLVTVVGNMMDVAVGAELEVYGDWRFDKKYGSQFMVQNWTEKIPATANGIKKYLGSGLIKGIGPVYAGKIVDFFGENTFNIIETDPKRLLEIKGIGKKKEEKIAKSWEEQKEIRNIMMFLQQNGVGTAYAVKIYKKYGDSSISKVKENPYRLADDIWGIGFKTADKIAEKMGFQHDDAKRCESGMVFTLNRLADDGNVFAYRDQLLLKSMELLEIQEENAYAALSSLLEQERVIEDNGAIYLPAFYHSECNVAKRLRELDAPQGNRIEIIVDYGKITKETGIEYDDSQREAIRSAVNHKVMVLTGGPGTGKTTTVLGIIKALELRGKEILLAAPTGRAAKRMTEATGKEAKTIHRLLEYSPQSGYERNETNPLEGDVLIVDESSMIDIHLMNALAKAVNQNMHLILVGDIDQLPSVGAGNVLRDIIASECFPVVRLTKIHRQAQTSKIVMNAHRINAGIFPDINNRTSRDFFFIEEEDTEKIPNIITELVRNRLPRYAQVNPMQIQVLCPMKNGSVGTANMNMILQNVLNPSTLCLRRGGKEFRFGDKVMQIKNDYDKGVFNGDVGFVSVVDLENSELTVDFDGEAVTYDASELDELVIAYASTVHKAQGSEYPVVVMPLTTSHYMMLQRSILYTGLTRAKKLYVCVGTKKAIYMAVHNQVAITRNTRLKERLTGEQIGSNPFAAALAI